MKSDYEKSKKWMEECMKFLKVIQAVIGCPDEDEGVFSVMVNLDGWVPNVGDEVEIASPSGTRKATVISANRIFRVQCEPKSILFEESERIPTDTFSILLRGIDESLVNSGDVFSKSGFCDDLDEYLK